MSTITEAVAALSRGGMVLVVDDEDRENEGDLIMAAEHATPTLSPSSWSTHRGSCASPLTRSGRPS